jgi:chitin synthase
VKAENTYLLALDGDIDFQAESITRLVDLMKKNKDLGAACGRIHPTGIYSHALISRGLST